MCLRAGKGPRDLGRAPRRHAAPDHQALILFMDMKFRVTRADFVGSCLKKMRKPAPQLPILIAVPPFVL
jgi:hypothetical protein